jgi:transcriptional regulator with XRE-family HTH domain
VSSSNGTPGDPETVAERVKAVMQSVPPKEGRNSRLGHISVEDFADYLGTSKQRVIDWRNGSGFPDKTNRERLAAASGGVYSADDFRGPTAAKHSEMTVRLGELEAEAADLRAAVVALLRVSTAVCREVEGMGGVLPADAIEELARVGLRMQPGSRPR